MRCGWGVEPTGEKASTCLHRALPKSSARTCAVIHVLYISEIWGQRTGNCTRFTRDSTCTIGRPPLTAEPHKLAKTSSRPRAPTSFNNNALLSSKKGNNKVKNSETCQGMDRSPVRTGGSPASARNAATMVSASTGGSAASARSAAAAAYASTGGGAQQVQGVRRQRHL